MKKFNPTRELVETIKKQEEEKYKEYGLKFNIETPTVIQYYSNYLKNGNFSFQKLSNSNNRINLIYPIYSAGWASTTSNDICVLSKNHSNYLYFLSLPLRDLKKALPYQEMMVTFITLHEIKHIVQHNGYPASAYEFFCSRYLSDYKGSLGVTNRTFHDSLFSEIDANYYGATEAKKYFSGNKDVEDYFDKLIGRYGVQKYTYDFDKLLEEYQKNNDKYKLKCNGMQYFEHFIWNFDGTLKRPREIYNETDFYKFQDEVPTVKEFNDRIIASDTYLSRLNLADLDDDEIIFVNNAIKNNNKTLELEKDKIYELYQENKINESQYKEAVALINNRISKKEEYRKIITNEISNDYEKNMQKNKSFNIIGFMMKNDNYTDDELNYVKRQLGLSEDSQISIEQVNTYRANKINEVLNPEPPKKVKLVTKIRETLRDKIKSLINSMSTVGSAVLALEIISSVAFFAMDNPLMASVAPVGVIGSSFIASEIYKAKSSKK